VRTRPPTRRRRHRRVRQRDRHKRRPKPEVKGHKLNYITIKSGREGSFVEHECRNLTNLHMNPRGVHLRMSTRWIQHKSQRSVMTPVEIPYIDKLGRYSGCTIYRAHMQPSSFISTVTSTIFKRIFSYSVAKNGLQVTRIRQAQLFRCAAYYSLSKNSYFWDRVITMVKDLGKNYNSLSRIAHKFSFKLDAPTRFVYGHICYQIQWLTFRAVKPRDKSGISDSYLPGIRFTGTWKEVSLNEFNCIWHTFNKMCQL